AGGRKRELGVPTVLDRLIQQALAQALTPIFDPHFSERSYGYRPSRSAQQAVRRARGYVTAGEDWVVDIDLDRFFDRVQHDALMARAARRVAGKRVLKLIRRDVAAGVMVEGVNQPTDEGGAARVAAVAAARQHHARGPGPGAGEARPPLRPLCR